ncbi:fungal-specific transcription factor domain-containing protein [Apodospora peruviana]|uniref:Fungal-specific transcription factor domain-containing protein n=1 Tax=Apodospora peruviana TaxID=516989 RepID=A0AAE0I507_9PEZI|nr:fungal-specific transcription factor domain-containing protein [Apodospora peruviana]
MRGHSCVTCYQRKVKCDGRRPCSTCVRHARGGECRSSKAVGSASDQAVLARLRRYEALLTANGIPLTATRSEGDDGDVDDDVVRESIESDDGHNIIQRGHPRFVDNVIWNRLGSELVDDSTPESTEHTESELEDEENTAATLDNLIFSQQPLSSSNPLRHLSPPIPLVFRLWQTFLDNFNPLVKLLHAPTTQQLVSDAVTAPQGPSPSTEALLFAIYLCAVTTMTDKECVDQFGESKLELLRRYSYATQHALKNARFLRSTDVVVLQALTLYLLARRLYIHDQSIYLLAGLATRLAKTIGLHREQSLKHLSPFEAEIRRRLWWQIKILDYQSAQVSGASFEGVFTATEAGDTRRPLNVSDGALSPYMRKLPAPVDDARPTEMLFCMVRLEVGECMRQMRMVMTRNIVVLDPLAEQEQTIDAFEARMESHLLKQCDVSVPLHLMATLMVRSAVCQMRLSIWQHQQQQQQQQSSDTTTDSSGNENIYSWRGRRRRLFELALKILEYDSLAYSTESLRPFLWHVANVFPFQAFIQVLTDLLWMTTQKPDVHDGDDNGQQQTAIDVHRGWAAVNLAYQNRPELVGNEARNPLYFALGNLVLKAWASSSSHFPMQPFPAIERLQTWRASRASQPSASLQADKVDYLPAAGSGHQDSYNGGPVAVRGLDLTPFVFATGDNTDRGTWVGYASSSGTGADR